MKRASGDLASPPKAATGVSTPPVAAGNDALGSKIGNNSGAINGHVETAAIAPTTAATGQPAAGGDNTDPSKSKKADSGVSPAGVAGRHHLTAAAAASSAELLYHYDPLSVFRAKDHQLKAVVPDVEVR